MVEARQSAGADNATPAVATSARKPTGGQVVAVLSLQRAAGNAAVARMIGATTAGRVQRVQDVRPDPEEVAGSLIAAVSARDAGRCRDLLRDNRAQRVQVTASYEKASGRTLQLDLAHRLAPDVPLAQALAYLRYDNLHHLAARMGMCLVKPRVSDDEALRLLVDNPLPLRKQMEAEYDIVYRGVHGDYENVLMHHLGRLTGLSTRTTRKARTLLERELTAADRLFLHDNEAEVVQVVQGEWGKGVVAFDQLIKDWNRYVVTFYGTLPLKTWVLDELSWTSRQNKKLMLAVFDGFDAVASGRMTYEQAAVNAAQGRLAAASSGWFGTGDSVEMVKAAGDVRQATEALEASEHTAGKGDAGAASAAATKAAEAKVKGKLWSSEADKAEQLIALRRKPTIADQVYVAMARGMEDKVLELVQTAWVSKREDELVLDAENPPAGDPRPRFFLGFTSAMRSGLNLAKTALAWEQIGLFITRGLSHEQRGAEVLRRMLVGTWTTTSGDAVGAAYRFLSALPDRKDRRRVVSTYAKKYIHHDADGLALHNRLHEHMRLDLGLEVTVGMADLEKLLANATTLGRQLKWAEARKKVDDQSRGVISDALVRFYDWASGEDTERLADEALNRLRDHVRMSKCERAELRSLMQEQGLAAGEFAKLGELDYATFKARLDEVRGVRNSAVDAVGQVVDFLSRSAYVWLMGPGAGPALLAALASYTLGMMAREAMLGPDYELISTKNLSTLVAEVGSSTFDFLKLEDAIRASITPALLEGWGLSSKMALHGSKFSQEFVKQSLAKGFEKVPENIVLQSPWPSAADIGERAFHAMTLAAAKTGITPRIRTPSLYDSYADRLTATLKKTIVSGPPPKSALIYAMAKELTGVIREDWDTTNISQKAFRFAKAGAVSALGTIPAAFALSGVAHREAVRQQRSLTPAKINEKVMADPAVRRLYEYHRSALEFRGEFVPTPYTWLKQAAMTDQKLRDWSDYDPFQKDIDVKEWLAKQATADDATQKLPFFR